MKWSKLTLATESCWQKFRIEDLKITKKIYGVHVGVSLNGGTPKTPQNDHF